MFLSFLLSSFFQNAHAVPLQLTQQGRVLDNTGAAVTGTHDLTFRIYDSSTAGTEYWSETLTVNFNNGYYAAILGTDEINNPLDSSTLALYPLYLEVQLDSNAPITTRYSINSAPYAQMAGLAETAESVDGGVVNASEVQINSTQVIDGSGNWVGQPITVDWSNIDPTTIPSYLADGDDNTQLSETEVETYITNGVIDLAANSQVNGSDIVTAGTFDSYLPTDVADGDADTLASLSCATGEIASWDGSTSWVCTSDATLSLSDIETMLANNAIDLNASTTIGGSPILTSVTDSDTLAALGCSDGEIAIYNQSGGVWECSAQTDTVLDEGTVETYITNGVIDLAASSQVNGSDIVTAGTFDSYLPTDIADGDADTQLSETEVETYITNDVIDLAANSQVNGSDIVTAGTFDSYLPTDVADGDADTLASLSCATGEIASWDGSTSWVCTSDATLSLSDIETMLANNAVDLNVSTTIGGATIVTSVDDSDTLAALSCAYGEVAKYDDVALEWYCASDFDTYLSESDVETYITNGAIDLHSSTTIGGSTVVTTGTDSDTLLGLSCTDGQIAKYNTTSGLWVCGDDTDTYLSESDVETYITNGAVDLYSGTTLDGNTILTDASTLAPDWNNLTSIPSDIEDGDDDTQLTSSQVVGYVEGSSVDLASGSTMDGNAIVTQDSGCTDGQILVFNFASQVWACGEDTDTTLTATEMQTMIESMTLNMSNYPSVNGSPVLTEASTIDPTKLDGTGGSSGQFLTTDGSSVSWGDSSGGCEVVSKHSGFTIIDCGGTKGIVNGSFTTYTQISAGQQSMCGLDSTGSIQCWGENTYGQINSPTGTFTQVSVGYTHACGINSTGSVQCWGGYGAASSSPPTGIFTQITAGGYHSCGIDSTGSVQCWGSNTYGESTPPSGTFTQVSAGNGNTCGLDSSGSIQCWGSTSSGKSNPPSGIFTSIAMGPNHGCGIDSTGSVQCWGNNSSGESTPPSGTFTSLSLGESHSCGIDSTGSVQCWGSDSRGKSTPPVGIFIATASSSMSTCGLLSSGFVRCWGSDLSGLHYVP